MKRTRWLVALLSGAALAVVPGIAPTDAAPTANTTRLAAATDDGTAKPDGEPGQRSKGAVPARPAKPGGQKLCRPGTPPDAPQTTVFYDGNRLFGPAQLPYASPVGPLLAGYQRFGAQTENEWVQNYTVPGDPTRLIFPPENGFVLGPDGKAIKQRQTMLPGYRLDRFGFTGGAFLAPLGTPFNARSLAPQSLNTPPTPPATTPPAPLANYHTYCVLKPFDVDSGPIAPWFAQPGLGTQFQLNPAYVPKAGSNLTVQWLLDHKYIVEEYLGGPCPNVKEHTVPRQGGKAGSQPATKEC
ncbi:TNT domain-containing protein [Micromonospora endophytica]|uniref:Uncharacterized protein n=1 Tax=Micromonospora endophytica TaxID=515350 RepID=A0A2W2CEA3_9ACTN|nr:TNT domain-containing protein [Micromonospora endophytica]PZF97641.1 hypothetical protein C1I93_11205 [Micromonospora endophytica]RIW46845.1 DUF4237 domain-containing protein [Micromonospora endophytica]BCJ59244.1 hypothetical protein Jiend_26660 [Micromonospora endophytica]